MTTHRPPFTAKVNPQTAAVGMTDEALVTDSRASLTPAQFVENKLFSLLRTNPVPLSQSLLVASSLRRRS